MHQSSEGSQEKHTRLPASRRGVRGSNHCARAVLESARLIYGLALAASPAAVARWSGSGTDPRSQAIRQVLGLRHVAQAVLLLGASRRAHRLGGLVDLTHASTAVWYAARTPARRGDALVNAGVTLLLAGAEFR